MRLLSIGRVPSFNLLLVGLGCIFPGISFYVIGALRISWENLVAIKRDAYPKLTIIMKRDQGINGSRV